MESIVRNCFFADFAADLGGSRGVHGTLSGGLMRRLGMGVSGTARGNLLGLCGDVGTLSRLLGANVKAWNADVTETSRNTPLEDEGNLISKGDMTRVPFMGVFRIRCADRFVTVRGGGAIRLDLGSSLGSPWVPRAVAGLGVAWVPFLFLAKDVLGRARFEIDCADGGRIPEPTLAAKEEFEVVLEAPELLR